VDIAKRLPEVLPIKRAEITATVSTSHQFLAQVANIFKKYSINVLNENYTNDGCEYLVSMVPGDYDKIISDLNQATKGTFQFDLEGGTPIENTTQEKGKGKGKKK